MLILSEFDIELTLPAPAAMIALLHLHPSLHPRLRSGDELLVESLVVPFPPNTVVPTVDYVDVFGIVCSRFSAPAGHLRLSGSNMGEGYSGPLTLTQYERFQFLHDELKKEGFTMALPTGN